MKIMMFMFQSLFYKVSGEVESVKTHFSPEWSVCVFDLRESRTLRHPYKQLSLQIMRAGQTVSVHGLCSTWK